MAMTKCKECKKDISDSADICPHCGIKDPNITVGIKVVSYILAIIVIAFLFSKCSDDPEVQTQTTNLISFKIVEKKDISFAGTPRMVYRILLNGSENPSKQNIKDVALKVWNNGNKSWKDFTIFFYLPEMDIHNAAYGIANFTPDGLKDFTSRAKPVIKQTKTVAISPDLGEYFYCGYTNIDGSSQDYSKWGKGTDFKYNTSKNRWEWITKYTYQYIYPNGKYKQIARVSYFDNKKGVCNSKMENIYKRKIAETTKGYAN